MPQATPVEVEVGEELLVTETTVSDATAPNDDRPRCEKCGQPTDAAACPACGWYPSLGVHVEIDPAYESLLQGVSPPEESDEAETASPDWRKHLEVWHGLIPGWGWTMLATTAGVFGLAIAARLATLTAPALHTACGTGGLVGGLAVAGIIHLVAFIMGSSSDASLGVFDVLVHPLKAWKPLLANLPERLWLVNTANASLSTAVAAALVVGGVPYERLLDWGFKAKPKSTLVAMIAEHAAAMPDGGAEDLEGAVGDFAGKAAGDLGEKQPTPRQTLDCLILGYRVTDRGALQSLLLAADSGGSLKYIGKVRPTLPAEEAAELLAKLESSPLPRPFVPTRESGSWVRPKFTCKATYTDWPQGKRPQELRWGELLDQLAW